MIKEYYTQWGGEEKRLFENPKGILERLRTESILKRFAPKSPAVVYDIGGGAGVYAFHLAQQGYQVHLVDLVSLHIEQAKMKMKKSRIKLAECTVGDARDVKAPDAVADIVLLFGPLYHLQDKKDREQTLQEAYRILKPEGILFVMAIPRIESFFKAGMENVLHDPYIASIVEEGLKTGNHKNPKQYPAWFTNAYFHHPDQFEQEVLEAHFKNVQLFNVQGPTHRSELLEKTLDSKESLKNLLYFLEMIETDRSIMGATSRIIAMGKK